MRNIFSEKINKSICVIMTLLLIVIIFASESNIITINAAPSYVDVSVTCMYDMAFECLDAINEQRAANGLSALVMDYELMEKAMQRSADALVLGEAYELSVLASPDEGKKLAHSRPDGTSYKTFVGRTTYVGENVASGYVSAESAVSDWMTSTSHRDNILKPYVSTGIGVVYCEDSEYGYYWTQLFSYDSASSASSYGEYPTTYSVPVSAEVYNNLSSRGAFDKGIISPSSSSGSSSGEIGWNMDSNGWWYQDASGNYYSNMWANIDGSWYYFDASGYMAANEWRDGCWLGSNGVWSYEGTGSWKYDSTGWWFEDTSGWYASGSWQKINGLWYYFGSDGYMVTNQMIDGYWINADGVCM